MSLPDDNASSRMVEKKKWVDGGGVVCVSLVLFTCGFFYLSPRERKVFPLILQAISAIPRFLPAGG